MKLLCFLFLPSLELQQLKIARARPALTRSCASLTCAQCAFWSTAQRSANIDRLNSLAADAPTGLSHGSPSALVILLAREALATLVTTVRSELPTWPITCTVMTTLLLV